MKIDTGVDSPWGFSYHKSAPGVIKNWGLSLTPLVAVLGKFITVNYYNEGGGTAAEVFQSLLCLLELRKFMTLQQYVFVCHYKFLVCYSV